MKTGWGAGVIMLVLAGPAPAAEHDFLTALATAYARSPSLEIARSSVAVADAGVDLARAAQRPSASVMLSGGKAVFNKWPYSSRRDPESKEVFRYDQGMALLSLEQPLYAGGGLRAQVAGAEAQGLGARASLVDSEQQVLLAAAAAYLDLWLAQHQLNIQRDNEQMLRRQWRFNQQQFERRDITITDLSQTQTHLAQAEAARVQAQNAVGDARIGYQVQVGQAPPESLATPPPALRAALPPSLEQAIARALAANPSLVEAVQAERAARTEIDVQAAAGKPAANLAYQQLLTQGISEGTNRLNQFSVLLELDVPIYQGGAVNAQVRAATDQRESARHDIEQARRSLVQTTSNAWSTLKAAEAALASYQTQVAAARLVVEGRDWEVQRGLSSVIDQLNAQSELNAARLSLQQAEHDYYLAQYHLLAAQGDFTARAIGLEQSARIRSEDGA